MKRRAHLWILLSAFSTVCAEDETCYPAGGVAGIVVATIIVTLVVSGLGIAVAWKVWSRKKGNGNKGHADGHHPQNHNQKPSSDFAFDNPYFKDPEGDDGDMAEKGKARSSVNKNSLRSSKLSDLSSKGKKTKNGKNHFMFGGGGGKKHRALDDSCLAVEPERTVVALRGHDFTGLGFNICGNMRDGILVKDVLHRGPASESGLIKAGDKIISVTVSFMNIVYEDALTILSYASPYDVQLEIERVPDKSRAIPNTPTGSKRLGSCSFNNSGQKLFHPLYRSQSIDDLTQIDKDTFPSHGLGPRRSQSVGVAAHKLAAHFKNSDTKLEEKERGAVPLILSTTGSLNEKMLANVISDGNLSKNGLQWEKRFEDTLESEDSESNNDSATDTGKGKSKEKKSPGILKSPKKNAGNSSDTSDETTVTSQNFSKKNPKYLDSPHTKGKLEMFKSPTKGGEESKTYMQQIERSSGRRAKTMAEASSALWQLDQSIKDGDITMSDLNSTRSTSWNKQNELSSSKHSVSESKCSGYLRRDEDNDSDVSHDSLELSNKRRENKKCKKVANISHTSDSVTEGTMSQDKSNVSENVALQKQSYSQKNLKKNIHGNDVAKSKGQAIQVISKNEYVRNPDREGVYSSNANNKSMIQNNSVNSCQSDADGYFDTRDCKHPPDLINHDRKDNDHKQSAVYANQRELHEKSNRNVHKTAANDSSNKANGRGMYGEKQKLNSSDNFSQSYGGNSRILINGETDEQKSKYISNSRGECSQKNSQVYHHKQTQETDESRMTESKNKSNQKFSKKASNPAGMFTQINPFQQQPRQKNSNFKVWTGREDLSKDVTSRSDHFTTSTYISTSDSSGPQSRRETTPDAQSYGQRLSDASKTVLISSYDSRNAQNSSQNFSYRQHYK